MITVYGIVDWRVGGMLPELATATMDAADAPVAGSGWRATAEGAWTAYIASCTKRVDRARARLAQLESLLQYASEERAGQRAAAAATVQVP